MKLKRVMFFCLLGLAGMVLQAESSVTASRQTKQVVTSLRKNPAEMSQADLERMLHKAAGNGDIEKVSEALDYGAQINARDAQGKTPLMLASRAGQLKCVTLLVRQHDMQLNLQDKSGMTALSYAVDAGQADVVAVLKKAGANQAIRNNKGFDACAIATILKERVKKIQNELACDQVVRTDEFDQKKLDSTLLQASLSGDFELVTDVIDRGANLNTRDSSGMTPLINAARRGHLDVVKVLCRQRGIKLNEQDADGMTALMYAVRANQRDSAAFLLTQGADRQRVNKLGKTALQIARDMQNAKLVRTLSDPSLEKGAGG